MTYTYVEVYKNSALEPQVGAYSYHQVTKSISILSGWDASTLQWRGSGRREPGRIGGGRGTGGERRKGGKRDSQSGGNREKK